MSPLPTWVLGAFFGPENPAAPRSPRPARLCLQHSISASRPARLRARPPKLCDAASSHPDSTSPTTETARTDFLSAQPGKIDTTRP